MSIGQNIRRLREQRNMSQQDLADIAGVSNKAVSTWENGYKMPRMGAIEKMAEFFAIPKSAIIDEDDGVNRLPPHPSILPIRRKRVRLLGEIAAGVPIYATEDYESYVWADGDTHCDFALRARGDSMVNARIRDGDIVFIREQPDVDDGEIAAVIVDDEATLKRLYHVKGGVTLVSENPKYAPMHFDQNNSDVIKILGKAVVFQSEL